MKSQQWKALERQVARDIGGERTGPTGKDSPDVLHDEWGPECKYGQERWYTANMKAAFAQAENNARGKKWFVVTHEKNTRNRYVTIPYKWFIELIKENKHG